MLDLTNYNKHISIYPTSEVFQRAAIRASGLALELKGIEHTSPIKGLKPITTTVTYQVASASQPVNYNVAIWYAYVVSRDSYMWFASCDCETYGNKYDGTRYLVCKHIAAAYLNYIESELCEVCKQRPVSKLALAAKASGVNVEQLCNHCRKIEQHMTTRSVYDKAN